MADDDPRPDPRFAPQFQRGFAGDASPVATTPVPPEPVPLDAEPLSPPTPATESLDDETPGTPRREVVASRAEWTLLGVGAVALIAAFSLFWYNATDVGSYTTNATDLLDYAWRDTRNLLPGPLFVGGFAAVAAWILVRALRTAAAR